MVDFTATQVQAKGGAPTASHEGRGGGTKAVVAMPPNVIPLPFDSRVHGLYHQLAKIHTIAVVQLAECPLPPV
jgi:hypothetical protein